VDKRPAFVMVIKIFHVIILIIQGIARRGGKKVNQKKYKFVSYNLGFSCDWLQTERGRK
jgi:hypothetical protein